jgi:hypothetical protein
MQQEKLEFELDRRVGFEDLKRGFIHLNDHLKGKFIEQDNLSKALCDTFTYLKLYLP